MFQLVGEAPILRLAMGKSALMVVVKTASGKSSGSFFW